MFYPSEEENASQEEKRRRGSLAVMEGWEALLVGYQLPRCTGVPCVTPCLPLPVLLASAVLCAHPVSMCAG